MLSLFQKVRSLFGGKTPAPAAAPAKNPKKHAAEPAPKKSAPKNATSSRPTTSTPRKKSGEAFASAPAASRRGPRSGGGRNFGAPRGGRSAGTRAALRDEFAAEREDEEERFAAPAAKAPKPQRPEHLKEVALAEGKTRFVDLPLPESIQYGIQNLGFEYCTPIQSEALPILLEGRDLVGKAQTGTGKTAAFLLAAFTRFDRKPLADRDNGTPRALVLAPTRELAMQIHKDAEDVAVFSDFVNVVVFGGMDHQKQRGELRQPIDILVGTPGRIIDFSRGGELDLSQVEILVIDEADRMLDMGFIPDVRRIVAQLPQKGVRQTMMFSATLEDSILRLAQSFLQEPAMIESEPDQIVSDNIEQTFYSVAGTEKLAFLLYLIRNEPFDRMLIFGNRKDKNLDVYESLNACGIKVELLSGDIPQQKRIRILEDFREARTKIVIATDVAARGIHVDDVSIVVNYDLPERTEDYVHRIGRTGRAGHKGKSISFICEYGAYYIPQIEAYVGEQFHSQLPTEAMVTIPDEFKDKLRSLRRGSRNRGSGMRSGSGARRPPQRKKW